MEVDTSVDRDDNDGAAKKVRKWVEKVEKGDEKGNLLLCWEHGELGDIVKEVGVEGYGEGVPEVVQKLGTETEGKERGEVEYPDDRYDIIWTVESPYGEIAAVTSEGCPGLDDGHENP